MVLPIRMKVETKKAFYLRFKLQNHLARMLYVSSHIQLLILKDNTPTHI